MSIKHLRTLVAIADNKTFGAAADVVHVTHAAVSQQMQSLEADLGVTLFDRRTRTPELTPIAQEIVAKARKMIAEYDNLVPSVLEDDGLRGVLRIGALRTTLTGLTPQAMAVLKAAHPHIGLHIRPGLTNDMLADIERGNLDAAIVTQPHLLPRDLQFRPLATEEMELIAAPQEEERDPIRLLTSRPYIRFNRNAVLGTLIDNWIISNRIRVAETMELDSPEAITSMVHANLGVSIVPRLAVAPYDNVSVKHISLGPNAPKRVLGLAHRRDQLKAQAIEALLEALSSIIDRGAAR